MNGNLVRERRKALGMTQMQLAVAVGASGVGVVSQWERGANGATVPYLLKLSKVLGVTVDELLDNEPVAGARR